MRKPIICVNPSAVAAELLAATSCKPNCGPSRKLLTDRRTIALRKRYGRSALRCSHLMMTPSRATILAIAISTVCSDAA